MSAYKTIGFIGLGVMGEPICRNLVKKSGAAVIAFDLAPEPLARMRAEGASVAGSVAEAVTKSDIVFLCLPSARHARAVFEGDGILKNVRKDQIVVDLGTSSVNQTRDFAKQLQAKGASWADAPIARTRQAAQDGTLSVMVGATPELYAALEPLIRCFATDVTRCGDIGAGQVTKILNNMVLFETVNALAEAVAVAKRNGVDPALLLDTLSKGSADSFALRNHGMKAIVPGNFPERAFSTEYALKDLSYALELAGDAGIKIRGAELIGQILQEAIDAGSGEAYFPVIAKHMVEGAGHDHALSRADANPQPRRRSRRSCVHGRGRARSGDALDVRAERQSARAHRREPGVVRHRQEQDPVGDRLHRRHEAEKRDEPRLGRMGRCQKSADAGLHRRRSGGAAYRGDRGDGGEVACGTSSFRTSTLSANV